MLSSVIFCYLILCFIVIYFILLYFILCNSILFCSLLFHPFLLSSILLFSILFFSPLVYHSWCVRGHSGQTLPNPDLRSSDQFKCKLRPFFSLALVYFLEAVCSFPCRRLGLRETLLKVLFMRTCDPILGGLTVEYVCDGSIGLLLSR